MGGIQTGGPAAEKHPALTGEAGRDSGGPRGCAAALNVRQ